MQENKIVFLWSHVRSLSTAFERSFMQRNDYITFHEPFGEPCYFGPERIYSYYDNDLSAHEKYINTTYSQLIEEILAAANNKDNKKVFVKDMTRHVIRPDYINHPENPTVLPIDFLKRCKHTFILRTPEKSVPSLYRAYVVTKQTFIPEDIGYPELQALYEFLTKLTGSHPSLIEADILLSNPAAVMKTYCEYAIQDCFVPSMLEWKSEGVEAFDKWPVWHDNAQYSTGFNHVSKPNDTAVEEIVIPDDVKELIRQSMPIYNKLCEFSIQV